MAEISRKTIWPKTLLSRHCRKSIPWRCSGKESKTSQTSTLTSTTLCPGTEAPKTLSPLLASSLPETTIWATKKQYLSKSWKTPHLALVLPVHMPEWTAQSSRYPSNNSSTNRSLQTSYLPTRIAKNALNTSMSERTKSKGHSWFRSKTKSSMIWTRKARNAISLT